MKLLLLGVCLSSLFAQSPIPAHVQKALDSVAANELKGDLSFLASDTLQGRFTPSPGLEVAAEFIASKFRAAGLEPGGDKDYFQMAEMVDRRLPAMTSSLTFTSGDHTITVAASDMNIDATGQAAHLDHAPVVLLAAKDSELLKGLDLKGKVVLAPEANMSGLSPDDMRASMRKRRAFDGDVSASGALANLTIVQIRRTFFGPARLMFADQAASVRAAALSVHSDELAAFLKASAGVTLTGDVPGPIDTKIPVKNVIGILRGSDPELSKTAVLLTAHYDHVGTVETSAGMTRPAPANSADRIYNGANDDGSGTVSVIEIARALAQIQPRPKRSIVFMTFFGEERGELGSQYYGKHPVFPIAQTVADLNLEQMGRTDSTAGPELNNASVTGFDYSDVTQYLVRAGEQTGIKVYKDDKASDAYFTRSDNDALAEQGVPAHTICVAFDYSDYHGLGDEWQKIDFDNMAKVDRMVLLALFNLADSVTQPTWNAQNSKADHFRTVRSSTK